MNGLCVRICNDNVPSVFSRCIEVPCRLHVAGDPCCHGSCMHDAGLLRDKKSHAAFSSPSSPHA